MAQGAGRVPCQSHLHPSAGWWQPGGVGHHGPKLLPATAGREGRDAPSISVPHTNPLRDRGGRGLFHMCRDTLPWPSSGLKELVLGGLGMGPRGLLVTVKWRESKPS